MTTTGDGAQVGRQRADGEGVPHAPDDLPRSPTGRIPQWAIDEATRTATAPEHQPPTRSSVARRSIGSRRRRRHRSSWPAATFLVIAALAGSWWMTNETPGLPPQLAEILDVLPGVDRPPDVRELAPPSDAVVALADAAYLSDEGREIFYSTHPQILDAEAFAGRCAGGHAATPFARGQAVGCYDGSMIVVFAPADARLYGFVVETAAHEALHAAWDRLSVAEQKTMTALLEAEVATVGAEDQIHVQINGSVGESPQNRPTELFAYVGTQLWRDGGLDPELEAVYARFVSDRAALVAVHTGWQGMLDMMAVEIQAATAAVSTQLTTNAQSRAQLDADRASVAYYDESYREKAAEVAAMSADEQERLRLSWVWWDGTNLPMARASTTLATAAGLLTRDAANLAEREVTLAAAEATAAAERTRVDAVLADLQALQAQLDPTATAG